MTSDNLKFELYFGQCHGSMTVNIFDNKGLVSTLENQVGTVTFTHDLTFPNTLKFVLTNKNSKIDTEVQDGKIIADKYVQLTKMSVGNIPVGSLNLPKLCDYHYNNQHTTSVYWSFNGTVNIDFNTEDFLMWHLTNNNKFEI
jgi:hypothetical protein